ncbi:MAG: response regulator [candidate division Zixibacteria bacterium]|nr:response regulator [candidate division Zixibacteria bacterium]
MSRILIVEDEPHLLELYIDELKEEGHEVEGYANGEEGLKRLDEFAPEVVVLDIKLENSAGGLEILKEVKSRNKNTRVILNSAYSTYKNDFTTWIADAYIVKSSDLVELKTKIKELGDSSPLM